MTKPTLPNSAGPCIQLLLGRLVRRNPPQRDAAPQFGPSRRERGRCRLTRRAVLVRAQRAVWARFPLDRAAALVDLMVQGIPPPHLQALVDSVAAGCGLRLYIPINELLRARGLAPKAGQMKRQRPDWH